MPKKSNKLKILLIILAVIIVIAIVVTQMGQGSTSTPATGLVTTTATGEVALAGVGGESVVADQSSALVDLLRNVSSLHLNRDVFSSPVFGALVDIGSDVPVDPNPGRMNPFLEIGQEAGSVPTEIVGVDVSDTPVVGDDALDLFLQ